MSDEMPRWESPRPPPRSATAQAIRRLRRSYGDTQVQFAKRIGVNRNSIMRWENGHTRPWPFVRWLLIELEAARSPPA